MERIQTHSGKDRPIITRLKSTCARCRTFNPKLPKNYNYKCAHRGHCPGLDIPLEKRLEIINKGELI